MTKYSKTFVAKVLKEVVAKNCRSLVVKDLGKQYFALASDYEIEVTFFVYFREKDCSYSVMYADIIHSSPYWVVKIGNLLKEIEIKLNKKIPIYDYPSSVIKAVEKWFLQNGDGILEEEVRQIPPKDIIEYYLEWEGVLGYTYTISEIFNAKVTYERED